MRIFIATIFHLPYFDFYCRIRPNVDNTFCHQVEKTKILCYIYQGM